MAVPRTHDGSVGPTPRSRSFVPTILTAIFAVVIVVCLVVLGTRLASASGSFGSRVGEVLGGAEEGSQAGSADDPRTREIVLSQANQFMLRINTYGPSDLDGQDKLPAYVARVKEVITPKLDVEFEKQVTLAEQSVAEAGLARSIQLYATGMDSLSADTASVLVTGAISQSYPDPAKKGRIEYEPLVFRYQVSLVKTGGSWLVDDFTPVTGEVEGEPTTGAPTEGPAGTADPAPTDGAGGSIVQRYSQIVTKRQVSISAAVDALSTCGFPAAAPASDASCRTAPSDLGGTVRVLKNSLTAAANPESAGFVGVPPAGITDLVDATSEAAATVLEATSVLQPGCVSGSASRCATQRTTLVSAINNLVTALRGWEAVR